MLPVYADDVAQFLRNRDIRAALGKPVTKNCPIARFLQDETGDPTITVGISLVLAQDLDDVLRLGPGATLFISRYDRREYPDLRP